MIPNDLPPNRKNRSIPKWLIAALAASLAALVAAPRDRLPAALGALLQHLVVPPADAPPPR